MHTGSFRGISFTLPTQSVLMLLLPAVPACLLPLLAVAFVLLPGTQ
jgi:hypothetical protein